MTSCQSSIDIHPVQVVVSPELDVALSTDLAVPQDIDSIRVERIEAGVSPRPISTEEHELGPTDLELPTVVRFWGLEQPELHPSVRIRVVAWKGVTPVVFAEALFTMPAVGAVIVPLLLEARCQGKVKTLADSSLASSCPDLQTCRVGLCASIDRRSESIQADGGTAGTAQAGSASTAQAGSAGESNP